MYFNSRHNLVGHVFQGRYGSELIETKDYELEVSRYIHLNPVEAEMVDTPLEYKWSSYRAYVAGKEDVHVRVDKILCYFSEPRGERYRKYVEGGA